MASTNQLTSECVEDKKDPEWALARQGINLFINNSPVESEALFLQHSNSLIMHSGYSFAVFMDALMSFEEEKLSKAITVLKEVERRCTTQNGWFKSISQKVFGSSNNTDVGQSLVDQLETQIILADSQVCLAIITFLQQDISGYFRGGWVLRKAWKVYQKTYKEILILYKEKIGESELPDPITTPVTSADEDDSLEWVVPDQQQDINNGYPATSTSKKLSHSRSLNFNQNHSAEPQVPIVDRPKSLRLKKSISVIESLNLRRKVGLLGSARFNLFSFTSALSLSTLSLKDILPGQRHIDPQITDKKTIKRLMGAISFGYGLFQLGVSLLPPSLTKIINLLGFTANRQHGIACLKYARLGVDMRAPLASLALLWYHTIVRPFYAIDGVNVQAGVKSATALIQESQKEYGSSALFLFFSGRANRLNSDIQGALLSFQKANDNANHREVKTLCQHEIGWCHLIELNYAEAKSTFLYLRQASRWSSSFYMYLSAICIGAIADYGNYLIFDELQKNNGNSRIGHQLDEFLARRLHCCPRDGESGKSFSTTYYKLLIFEMLYLWNALASCTRDNIRSIIRDCDRIDNEPRRGLSNLILGSCYNLENDLTRAEGYFRQVLIQRKSELTNAEDAHISAFAQYELGNILIQNPNTKEEGKAQLQGVCRYSNYDFEARLNVRIHSVLRQLD